MENKGRVGVLNNVPKITYSSRPFRVLVRVFAPAIHIDVVYKLCAPPGTFNIALGLSGTDPLF